MSYSLYSVTSEPRLQQNEAVLANVIKTVTSASMLTGHYIQYMSPASYQWLVWQWHCHQATE